MDLDPILRPRAIAVIGASRAAHGIGHQIVANLVRYGFTGAVYPVNPQAHAIHSVRAYPTVAALPEVPDMAVIAVPKAHVAATATACGEAGVRGLVVISAMAIAMFEVFAWLERRMTGWATRGMDARA